MNDLASITFTDGQVFNECASKVAAVLDVSKLVPLTSLCIFEGTPEDHVVNVWYFGMRHTLGMVLDSKQISSTLNQGETIGVDAKELAKLAGEMVDEVSITIEKQKDGGKVQLRTCRDTFNLGTIDSDFSMKIGEAKAWLNGNMTIDALMEKRGEGKQLLPEDTFRSALSCIYKESAALGGCPNLLISEHSLTLVSNYFASRTTVDALDFNGFTGLLNLSLVDAFLASKWDAYVRVLKEKGRVILMDSTSFLMGSEASDAGAAANNLSSKVMDLYGLQITKACFQVDKPTFDKALKKLNFTSSLNLIVIEGNKNGIHLKSDRGQVRLLSDVPKEEFTFKQSFALTSFVSALLAKAPKGTIVTIAVDQSKCIEHVVFNTDEAEFHYFFAGMG